jgi:hypothetical protein
MSGGALRPMQPITSAVHPSARKTEGSSTFVTGSTLVEGRTTAPDEIRGSAITDGESRRLGKADAIIVPNGTPHWFGEVDGLFLYYVVKVR